MLESTRVAGPAPLLLPAGLVAFFGFNSGGFSSRTTAYIAVLRCIALTATVTSAGAPFERARIWLVGDARAIGLHALLSLVSRIWSRAPGLAVVEFDRALVYLLAMSLRSSS